MSEKKLLYVFGAIAVVSVASLLAILFFGAPNLHNKSVQDEPQANLNQFGQAVASLGLPECANKAHGFLEKFGSSVRIGAYAFPREDKPKNLFFSMEIQLDGGVTSYGSATVAKEAGRGCHVSGEVMTHWVDPCDQVGKIVYTAFTPAQILNNTMQMYSHTQNPKRKLFLLPVANGCIAVDKSVE